MDYTKDDEIKNVKKDIRPHVVILGAGASYAAFPKGDKNGNKLPLMNNFIETLELEYLFDNEDIDYKGQNFEEFYSKLCEDQSKSTLISKLEQSIFDYFSKLELPDEITIYDLLVCSLREQDVIATFNWDPFLFQALFRNHGRLKGRIPKAIYLHGNVAIGYHEDPFIVGPVYGTSSKNKLFKPTQLLFPIEKKDYQSDSFTKRMWTELRRNLKEAFLITIFGYSMPDTDIEAKDLLSEGWGDPSTREFEELQIIDILKSEELEKKWSIFIHTHHYTTIKRFADSTLFRHPRRSVECECARLLESKFLEGNPMNNIKTFEELDRFIVPLLLEEERSK